MKKKKKLLWIIVFVISALCILAAIFIGGVFVGRYLSSRKHSQPTNFQCLKKLINTSALSHRFDYSKKQNVTSPPRGWNSYDSFDWIISEQEFIENAEILHQRLLYHEYQYCVVDYLWYRNVKGKRNSRGLDSIDKWGRLLPDPKRWPSSNDGRGFSKVASELHCLGLKFGIHLMAGISTQAYDSNTPILDTTTGRAYEEYGRTWHAKDIGIPERACKWMSNGFMAINTTSRAGKAFLRSIYELYASWGVDFVKLDCVFGDDLDMDEINVVSQIIEELNHTIILSVSPGVSATPKMAKALLQSSAVTTYRITGDDWDQWPHLVSHFDIIRDFAKAKLIGAVGLHGKSWPDLDMLPFGWLTDPDVEEGPHRLTRLTQDEQRTQMTLWCMAKSPLMYGGDLRRLDNWTYSLITNPTLLRINSLSKNNQEAYFDLINKGLNNEVDHAAQNFSRIRSWIATGSEGEIYVAFFNLNDEKARIFAKIKDLARVLPWIKWRSCNATEIWSGRRRIIRLDEFLSSEIVPHGCTLFTLSC